MLEVGDRVTGLEKRRDPKIPLGKVKSTGLLQDCSDVHQNSSLRFASIQLLCKASKQRLDLDRLGHHTLLPFRLVRSKWCVRIRTCACTDLQQESCRQLWY